MIKTTYKDPRTDYEFTADMNLDNDKIVLTCTPPSGKTTKVNVHWRQAPGRHGQIAASTEDKILRDALVVLSKKLNQKLWLIRAN